MKVRFFKGFHVIQELNLLRHLLGITGNRRTYAKWVSWEHTLNWWQRHN